MCLTFGSQSGDLLAPASRSGRPGCSIALGWALRYVPVRLKLVSSQVSAGTAPTADASCRQHLGTSKSWHALARVSTPGSRGPEVGITGRLRVRWRRRWLV
jgi:hypothetical protein